MNIITDNIFLISILIALAVSIIISLLTKRQKESKMPVSIGFIQPEIKIAAYNNAVNAVKKENLDKDISYNFLFEFQDNNIKTRIMSIARAKNIYRKLKERFSCFDSRCTVAWDYGLLPGKRRLTFSEFIDYFNIKLQGGD